MWTRRSLTAISLILMLSGLGSAASAQEAGDPIIRLDSNTKIELDLGIMMDDLLPRLMAAMAEEEPEEAEMFIQVMDLIGIDALQVLKSETKQTRDRTRCKFEITLDPQREGTLIYDLMTVPNGKCRFGRHVNRDELVVFMTIHNLPHYLDAVLDFLATPEILELAGEMPVNAAGELDLGGFVPRNDLLPLLSGEFDILLLDTGDDATANPMMPPFVMVIGAHDGAALLGRIVEITAMMNGENAGMDIGAMLDAVDAETVGDFELKALPMGGAFATSEDYLVLGMDPDLLRGVLAEADGDLRVPDGIEWVFMDGPKYGAYMESILAMASAMSPDEQDPTMLMMGLYDVLFDHLEYEEILYRSTGDGVEGEIEVRGPVMTGYYRMLVALVDKLPELMAMYEDNDKDEGSDYRQAILETDAAMMAWAEDHDGFYPAAPTELLEEGYLTEWPFQGETPAGVFADWAYTYHSYLDEDGNVEGYILFLYGGSENAGYDVYTDENLAADGFFEIGADGMPDGVISFCYDGVALEPVQEFFNQ